MGAHLPLRHLNTSTHKSRHALKEEEQCSENGSQCMNCGSNSIAPPSSAAEWNRGCGRSCRLGRSRRYSGGGCDRRFSRRDKVVNLSRGRRRSRAGDVCDGLAAASCSSSTSRTGATTASANFTNGTAAVLVIQPEHAVFCRCAPA